MVDKSRSQVKVRVGVRSESGRCQEGSSSVSSEFSSPLLYATCGRLRTTRGFVRNELLFVSQLLLLLFVVVCQSVWSSAISYYILLVNAGGRGESSSRGEVRTREIRPGERYCLSISSDIINMLFDVTLEDDGESSSWGEVRPGKSSSGGLFVR